MSEPINEQNQNEYLDVEIVIRGNRYPLPVWRHARVMAIIQGALWKGGTTGGFMDAPENWELRDQNGRLLDPYSLVGLYDFNKIGPLHVNPKPRVGA